MRMRAAAAFTLAVASTLSTALASAPPAEALPIAAPATVVTKTGCFPDGDHDETRGLLWLLRSGDGCATLTLRSYSPSTDAWGTAVSVPSDTVDVAIAADDASIYTARADGTIQRRSLPSLAVTATFDASTGWLARIATSDNDPDVVLVEADGDIAAFDDGVQLGATTSGQNLHKLGRGRYVVRGLNADRVLTLGPTGLSSTDEVGDLGIYVDGQYDDGSHIYLPDGRILDSATFALAGVVGRPGDVEAVYRDAYSDDIYFVANRQAYVRNRITGATATIPQALGIPYTGVPLGAGRTATWTTSELRIIDVRLDDRTPLPNVGSARRLDALTLLIDGLDGDVTAHAPSKRLYATASGLTAGNGNAVFQFDSASGRMLRRLQLGDEPGQVDVSNDGSRLYVALATGWVVRVDTATMTEIDRFLPRGVRGWQVSDLAVLRDRPESVAVVVAEEVVIVDGTTPRPNRTGGSSVSPGRTSDEIYTTCGDLEELTCSFNPCEPDPDCPLGLIRLQGTRAFTLTAAGFPKNAGRSVDRVGETLVVPDRAEWGTGDAMSISADQLARYTASQWSSKFYDDTRGLLYSYASREFVVEVAYPAARVGSVMTGLRDRANPLLIDTGRFALPVEEGLAIVTMSVATHHEGEFTALTPTRILDTRSGLGRGGERGALAAGQTITVDVATAIDTPAVDVNAVVMTATVTQPTAGGYLTVYPSDVDRPDISNINFAPGDTVPNLVTVAVGADGKVEIYHPYGRSHVLLDVVGFYTGTDGVPGGRFRTVEPKRVIDTRVATGVPGTEPLGPGEEIVFDAVGAFLSSDDDRPYIRAVVLNVTAVGATTPTFVTVYPSDVERPEASNLNPMPGRANANQVIATVGRDGMIRIYNHLGNVHLIADIAGYFIADYIQPGGRFVPYVPDRLLDTRVDSPFPAPGWLPPESAVYFDGLSTSLYGAWIINTTATQPTAPGYLAVAPWTGSNDPPQTSSVNFLPGMTIANHVIVRNDGGIAFWNMHGNTHVVADVFGGFLKDDTWDEATSQGHGAPMPPAPGPFDDPEGASLASSR